MRRLEEIKRRFTERGRIFEAINGEADSDIADALALVALVEQMRDALEPFATMRPTWKPGEQTQLILMDRTELDDARAALAAADGTDDQRDGEGR